MKLRIATLLLSASLPGLAAAQEISGGITLGFGQHDFSASTQDLDTTGIDGRVKLNFDNGVTMGVSAGYIDVGIDGIPITLDANFIGLDLGYRFSNGFTVGTFFEQLTAGANILPIDLSLETIGLSAGYSMGQLEVEAFFGQTSTSPDLALIGGGDVDNIGLTAQYAVAPNFDIAAALLRATINVPGSTDVDIDTVGLAAVYDINAQFSVFGGYNAMSVDVADLDLTTMGLGVGYNLPEMGGVSSTLSLELARTEVSLFGGPSENLDTIRLGLTIPLGGKGTETPLNSVADSVFNPRRGALNAGLTGAF